MVEATLRLHIINRRPAKQSNVKVNFVLIYIACVAVVSVFF